MPAGTWTCVGLALAGAALLAVGAGDVAAGLAGDKSLVVPIGWPESMTAATVPPIAATATLTAAARNADRRR
jgi:hypothetical protein